MIDLEALIEYCQDVIDRPIADMLTSGGEEAMRRGARQALTVLKAKLEDGHFETSMRDGIHIGLVKDGQYASVILDLSYSTSDDIYLATMRQLEQAIQRG